MYIWTQEQQYELLRPIATAAILKPVEAPTISAYGFYAYPFSNSDSAEGFGLIKLDHGSRLQRLLRYEAVDIYRMNQQHSDIQQYSQDMQADIADDEKTLLLYYESLATALHYMEYTEFHSPSIDLKQEIHSSFSALLKYLEEQNLKKIISQFFREGNYPILVDFVSFLSICSEYQPLPDDLRALMRVLTLAKAFFPQEPDNYRLAGLIQEYLYPYNLQYPNTETKTYQLTVHNHPLLCVYFLTLTTVNEKIRSDHSTTPIKLSIPKAKIPCLTSSMKRTAIQIVVDMADHLLIAHLQGQLSALFYQNAERCIEIMIAAAKAYDLIIEKKPDLITMLFHIKQKHEEHLDDMVEKNLADHSDTMNFEYKQIRRQQESLSSQLLRLIEKQFSEDTEIHFAGYQMILQKIAARLIMKDLGEYEYDAYYQGIQAWASNSKMTGDLYNLCIVELLSTCINPMLRFKKFEQLDSCLDVLEKKSQSIHGSDAQENAHLRFIQTVRVIARFIQWMDGKDFDNFFQPLTWPESVKPPSQRVQLKLQQKNNQRERNEFQLEFNAFFKKEMGDLPAMTFPDKIISGILKMKIAVYTVTLAKLKFERDSQILTFLSGLSKLLSGKTVPEFAAQVEPVIEDADSASRPAVTTSVDDLAAAIEGKKTSKKTMHRPAIPFDKAIPQQFAFNQFLKAGKTRPSRDDFMKQLAQCFETLLNRRQQRAAIDLVLTSMFNLVEDKQHHVLLNKVIQFLENDKNRPVLNSRYSYYMKRLILGALLNEQSQEKLELLKRHYETSAQREPEYLTKIEINQLPKAMEMNDLEVKYINIIDKIVRADEARVQSEQAKEAARRAAEEQARVKREEEAAARSRAKQEALLEQRRLKDEARAQEEERREAQEAARRAQIDKQVEITDCSFPKLERSPTNRFFSAESGTSKEVSVRLPEYILRVFRALDDRFKNAISLVGGAPRDLLLGHKPRDFDFVYEGPLDELKEEFTRVGIDFETVGTTHPLIKIKSLKIDISQMEERELEDDARRRGFTISALYVRLTDNDVHPVYDPLNQGLDDLSQKIFRATDEAVQMIKGDPTKLLRFIKMSSRLEHFKPDPALAAYLKENQFSKHTTAFIRGDGLSSPMANKSRLRTAMVKQVLTKGDARKKLKLMNKYRINPLLAEPFEFNCKVDEFASLDPDLNKGLNKTERFCYFFIEYILQLQQRQPNYDYSETLGALIHNFWFPRHEQELFRKVITKLTIDENSLIDYAEYKDQFPNLERFVTEHWAKYIQTPVFFSEPS